MSRCTSRRQFAIVLFVVCGAALAGCHRFEITDPTTERIYYTKHVRRTDSGGIRFKDAVSGSKVTLQTSEMHKISKKTFRDAVRQ